jgi:hypothetical protein
MVATTETYKFPIEKEIFTYLSFRGELRIYKDYGILGRIAQAFAGKDISKESAYKILGGILGDVETTHYARSTRVKERSDQMKRIAEDRIFQALADCISKNQFSHDFVVITEDDFQID